MGVAAAGVLAGQAMQRRLARSQLVELFIRPTDGRDFVVVQPTRGMPFCRTESQGRLSTRQYYHFAVINEKGSKVNITTGEDIIIEGGLEHLYQARSAGVFQ